MSWITLEKKNPPSGDKPSKFAAVELFVNLVKIGIERGNLEDRDPVLAANTVLGMVNLPIILFHTGRVVDLALKDQMMDETFSIVMLYLKGK